MFIVADITTIQIIFQTHNPIYDQKRTHEQQPTILPKTDHETQTYK
jgi:hypothetical protein